MVGAKSAAKKHHSHHSQLCSHRSKFTSVGVDTSPLPIETKVSSDAMDGYRVIIGGIQHTHPHKTQTQIIHEMMQLKLSMYVGTYIVEQLS